ncbi:Uncharacterised protein [Vibrio cholerae]|nr:Uncharacterised protein [Vibrio cholerae]CSC35087.1 Uncharacterised protein [Vibrio cholerae]
MRQRGDHDIRAFFAPHSTHFDAATTRTVDLL